MNTSLLIFFIFSSITITKAAYFQVLIREIENPAGTTQNGEKCSNFDFLAIGCTNTTLKAGVAVGNQNPSLSVVNINSNGERKISNINQVISDDSVTDTTALTNFTVRLELNTADNITIDNANFTISTSDSEGVYSYTSVRPGTLSITYSIAWSTDLSPPTTTTTPLETSTQQWVSPTSAPKRAVDCSEVENVTSGVQTIYPDGVNPVQVYCDKTSYGVYTVIQSRSRSSDVNFNVTFENYTQPIGQPDAASSYWFGLENMNVLTTNSKNYSLQIDICCNGSLVSKQIYYGFTIGDKGSNYTLNAIPDVPGIGLDFLAGKKDIGAQFATSATYNHDLKKDGCDELEYMSDDGDVVHPYGGWWFGSCGNNLNGAILSNVNGTCSITDFKNYLGVNLRLDKTIFSSGYAVDLISYDRVRMSIFNFDSLRVDKNDDSFCKM